MSKYRPAWHARGAADDCPSYPQAEGKHAVGMHSIDAPLTQVIQHHEGEDLGRVGGALDRSHVIVGMGVLMLARPEIGGRDPDMVEVALVEGGRRKVCLRRLAQHYFA